MFDYFNINKSYGAQRKLTLNPNIILKLKRYEQKGAFTNVTAYFIIKLFNFTLTKFTSSHSILIP